MQPLDAERVKEWRHRRMLSQQEVADRAGTSLFTIQRIERGEGNVRPKTGRGVAAALGVPIEELLPKAQAPLFRGLPEQKAPEERRIQGLPQTPLAASSHEEIETKLFGGPDLQIDGELSPAMTEPEAREISDAARQERDALEDWIKRYAAAPDSERFSQRVDYDRAQMLRARAAFYHDWIFDYWSKLYDPRPVLFKGAQGFASELVDGQALLFDGFRAEAERMRMEESGEAS